MNFNPLFKLLFFLLIIVSKPVTAQNWLSAFASENGDINGYEIVTDAAQDKEGNIYMIGNTTSQSFTFNNAQIGNNGSSDIFLAKMNSSGIIEWSKNIGGVAHEYAYFIDIDSSENIYIVGQFEGQSIMVDTVEVQFENGPNWFIAKFQPNGKVSWASKITSISGWSQVFDIIQFEDGVVVSSGSNNDFMLTKFNEEGNILGTYEINGTAPHISDSKMIRRSDDSLVIVINTDIQLQFPDDTTRYKGTILFSYKNDQIGWVQTYNLDFHFLIDDFKINQNDELFLSLSGHSIRAGGFGPELELSGNSKLMKLSPYGKMLNEYYDDEIPEAYKHITPVSDGAYITGSFSETFGGDFILGNDTLQSYGRPSWSSFVADGFITKLKEDGSFDFSVSYGSNNSEHSNFLFTYNNTLTVIGSFDCEEFVFGNTTLRNNKSSFVAEHFGNSRLIREYKTFVATCEKTTLSVDSDLKKTFGSLLVYPNPNDGNFFLKNIKLNEIITIVDPLGKEVYKEMAISNYLTYKIKLSEKLASGLYYVNVASKNTLRTGKIIIK